MTMQMRWLRSFSRKGPGSVVQQEWGSPVYYTLQFRTISEWRGSDDISKPLEAIFTEWANVEMEEE